jgi:predicted MFS family arabinose efflux permease
MKAIAPPLPRLLRATLGGELERPVLPVAAISFIYSASFSTFWIYVGVYVVKGLGWPAGRVGVLFLVTAPTAAVANYLSGRLSDRVGRKRLIVASFALSSINLLTLAAIGKGNVLPFGLIVAQGVIGAPAYSLDRVVATDVVVDRTRRESAFATLRVATNLGAFSGPPLAALLIFAGGWRSFLAGLAALGVLGVLAASMLLPTTGRPTERERDTAVSLRTVFSDRPFALLLLSTLLAFTDYCGFEAVLPVIAVTTYGLSPSTWGLLVVISPLLVVLLQLRVLRISARIPTAERLGLATLLMGLPFLALGASADVPVIAGVIVVFIVGEMVWMPTSQAVAAQLAPPAARGSYFGALAAMTGPAWTLAPLIALELRSHVGVNSVWLFFAGVAAAGAVTGFVAVHASEPRGATRYVKA